VITRVLCSDYRCRWHGTRAEVLRAPSPFDAEQMLNGCPKCKAVDTIVTACDEPDCWEPVSCGTPTPTGYRNTCGKHFPE
jgi:hypothetical protein